MLTDTDYWSLCSHFNAQMHRLETDVAEDVEGMHTDLANTKSAMSEELSQTHQKMAEELSETENRMGEKVTAATSAMKDTQNSMDAAVAQMNKRLDANVTASTDSKADYAAELVDTRVDSEGTTYPSAGEAIRSITAGLARKLFQQKWELHTGMRILFRIVWKVQLFTAWFIMFLVIREPFSAFSAL